METEEKPPDPPVGQASHVLDIVPGTFLQRIIFTQSFFCVLLIFRLRVEIVTLLRMRSSKKVCLVVTSQGQ